jgi:hypothetical protein
MIVAKIGGESGQAVASRFRGWAKLRVCEDPTEFESSQWPLEARREMDEFASSLRIHGHELPVVYFNEHVDLWLSAGTYEDWLMPGDGPQAIEVHADQHQLWCYTLPDGDLLAKSLQAATRLKRIRSRSAQEERWFTIQLLEAVLAWTPIIEVAAIVVVRQVFGGFVEDQEIKDSTKLIPSWIKGSG